MTLSFSHATNTFFVIYYRLVLVSYSIKVVEVSKLITRWVCCFFMIVIYSIVFYCVLVIWNFSHLQQLLINRHDFLSQPFFHATLILMRILILRLIATSLVQSIVCLSGIQSGQEIVRFILLSIFLQNKSQKFLGTEFNKFAAAVDVNFLTPYHHRIFNYRRILTQHIIWHLQLSDNAYT